MSLLLLFSGSSTAVSPPDPVDPDAPFRITFHDRSNRTFHARDAVTTHDRDNRTEHY